MLHLRKIRPLTSLACSGYDATETPSLRYWRFGDDQQVSFLHAPPFSMNCCGHCHLDTREIC
jgi:hypothetical protein